MPRFSYDSIDIAFLDQGEGRPIVLVHGFASNKEVNWVYPGWVATLMRASRRVSALDNRGHGQSVKLYEPGDYHSEKMATDICKLLDHLGLPQADVMGYSLGAQICAFMALKHAERVHSVILGGLGSRLIQGVARDENIVAALEAPSLAQISDPKGRQFRAFAEQTNSDLRALAACFRGSRQTLTAQQASSISATTLIAVGTKDEIAGSPQALADCIPDVRILEIPGRDHMLAVGDKVFKSGVLAFLAQGPERN
jgi:pimeloyl-ACP methyl ester carboxylesterase